MDSKLWWIIAVALFGAIVATDQSYEEAQNEQDYTEDMICQGYWPPEVAEFEVDCERSGQRSGGGI